MKDLNILTVGTGSGIGKYIYQTLGGKELTRATSPEELRALEKNGVDIIIHCARNDNTKVTSESLYNYINDNVFLTKRLTKIPHKKFIYFSSVEVYPKDRKEHFEDEIIDINELRTIYGVTKLMSETIVINDCKNYISIRAAALLGKEMKKNSFAQILADRHCKLSLAPNSNYNYVLYSDILEFIRYATKYDLTGIYNAAGAGNIKLSDLSDMIGAKPQYGDYVYNIGEINTIKIAEIIPGFRRSSKENIEIFMKEFV